MPTPNEKRRQEFKEVFDLIFPNLVLAAAAFVEAVNKARADQGFEIEKDICVARVIQIAEDCDDKELL